MYLRAVPGLRHVRGLSEVGGQDERTQMRLYSGRPTYLCTLHAQCVMGTVLLRFWIFTPDVTRRAKTNQ